MIGPAAAGVLVVCTTCRYHSLQDAVVAAGAGSRIVVRGRQPGELVVIKPVTIEGDGNAEITGGRFGLRVKTPHVTVRNLTLRGFSSDDLSGRDAAIVVEAKNARISNVRISKSAFGITMSRADGTVVEGSVIEGTSADSSTPGDAIRIWNTAGAVVRGTKVSGARDILVSYSTSTTFENNRVSEMRYALHNMFSNAMVVRGNRFQRSQVGANFMYARDLTVTGNTFEGNRGAAGYGVGMEDVDAASFRENRFLANRVGMNCVDSPSLATVDRIAGNLFAHNGTALSVQSDPHALRITGNAFVDNLEDVGVSGGGAAQGIVWTDSGRGNYWSLYPGYDRNADEIGDFPYAPRGSFESLSDLHPELQMFRYSPASAAIDFAARAIPVAAPEPKFVDGAPLTRAPIVQNDDAKRDTTPLMALVATLGLLPLAVAARLRRSNARVKRSAAPVGSDVVVRAVHVRRLYDRERGVSDVTLDVKRGEAVALWGPNGAGKTTFVRCMLGERHTGRLRIFGHVPRCDDVSVRALIGYAPQYLPDFDLRVAELAAFVAALRGASRSDADEILHRMGFAAVAQSFVTELSGGMRQRLAVALALIGDPPLLVLDEPTAGLDRESRDALIAILHAERSRGKTLIFISHLLEDVRDLADRVIVLENGIATEEVAAAQFIDTYLGRAI